MSTRGILNPTAGARQFVLERLAASSDLSEWIENHWVVRWDLRGEMPFVQETLPHPSVNVVVGTHRPGVHGVGTRRFAAELRGEGWVVGVKFRPGGFRPFFGRDVSELTETELPIDEVFGARGATVDAEVHRIGPTAKSVERLESFFRAMRPAHDDNVTLVARAVDHAREDPSIARTSSLAEHTGVAPRTLERLFKSYVGVSPKWIIRRFRIHEACERAASGDALSWSALAQELGYYDQAHFTRDFKAQVGATPARYASACAAATLATRR